MLSIILRKVFPNIPVLSVMLITLNQAVTHNLPLSANRRVLQKNCWYHKTAMRKSITNLYVTRFKPQLTLTKIEVVKIAKL